MGKVGNRVRLTIQRPSREIVKKFRDAKSPELADAMNRSGAMRGIQSAYTPVSSCFGPAVTVKVPTGDSLMLRKAMQIAQPGDVIVVDGRGDISRALWGGNRSKMMAAKGVAGVIIDAAVRDAGETREIGLPLYSRGINPSASSSVGPGEVNFPISCGGVVVCPGDIVVADDEGIVVIPRDDAEDVYQAWLKVVQKDQATSKGIDAGQTPGEEVVDPLLGQAGTEILP